jgi:hypothetical protein
MRKWCEVNSIELAEQYLAARQKHGQKLELPIRELLDVESCPGALFKFDRAGKVALPTDG